MNREKTDSMTHLCKIIAEEVFTERMRTFHTDFYRLGEELCQDIKSSLAQAGKIWPPSEDELLAQEVKVAIAQIAKNHRRSSESIRCRIRDKEYFK